MPYRLHVVKTSDFVRFDAHGKPDLEKSRKLLAEIARVCVETNVDCALVDIRDAQGQMSFADVYQLAKAFPETGFSMKHRLAILHRYNAGDRAEMFAMFASDRGWNVDAFDNYEDAMKWFSTDLPAQ